MKAVEKPLAWLHGEVKTPPMSRQPRVETGVLLRRLQRGERLAMPHSRPMPTVPELRVMKAELAAGVSSMKDAAEPGCRRTL